MSQPVELPFVLFPFERFKFTIKVTSLMVLPPYKGAVFWGDFGNAFRRVVCAVPRGIARPVCSASNACMLPNLPNNTFHKLDRGIIRPALFFRHNSASLDT